MPDLTRETIAELRRRLIAAAINALPALLAAAERGLGAGDGR